MAWPEQQSNLTVTNSDCMKFEDDFVFNSDHSERLPDSKLYLSRLESKLSRLKDQNNVSSKQILDGLQQAREFYMNQLLERSRVSSSSVGFVSSEETKGGLMTNVERHLFPEKAALTAEELQKLLEADLLAKNSELLEESKSAML